MTKPIFFRISNKYYNVNHIVNFETYGTNHKVTMSSGEVVTISTSVKFSDFIYVVNPPEFEDKGGKYNEPPINN